MARDRSRLAGPVVAGLLLACAALHAPDAAARPGKRPATESGNPPQAAVADRTRPQVAIADPTPPRDAGADRIPSRNAAADRTLPPDAAALGPEAALRAVALIGVPYRWGGNRPATGLDCSGLVHHVFGEIGLATPRDTRGLSRAGATVARKSLQPGDLVFFNTLRRAYSHVGIYLGDGRFVHAPSAGAEVRIESMNASYWRQRYNGARRLGPAEDAAPAPATPVASSIDGDSNARSRVVAQAASPARPGAVARDESTASFYQY